MALNNLKPIMKEKVLGDGKPSLLKKKPFGKTSAAHAAKKSGLAARLTGGK